MKIDQTFYSSHVSVSRWKIPVWFNPLVHLMVHEEGWATMPESPVLFTSIETKTHCGCYGYFLYYTCTILLFTRIVHYDKAVGLCLYSPRRGLLNEYEMSQTCVNSVYSIYSFMIIFYFIFFANNRTLLKQNPCVSMIK